MALTDMFGGRYGIFSRNNYIQPAEFSAMQNFLSSVKNREDVTEDHYKLKETIEGLTEDYPDNINEDEQGVIQRFQKKFFDLFDDRTKRQKIDDLIDSTLRWSHSKEDTDAEYQKYYPQEYGKELRKKGDWIMLRTVLPIESKYQNHKYDVYYAVPIPSTKQIGDPEDKLSARYYKVQIVVNGQEVTVWPHEYVKADIQSVMKGIGDQWELIRLGGSSNYDAAKVHYLGTRGISKEQVYLMLMGSINSLNYCFYRLNPEAHEYYDFVFDCLERGIRFEIIDRLWHSKQTGQPLFKIKEVKHDQDTNAED